MIIIHYSLDTMQIRMRRWFCDFYIFNERLNRTKQKIETKHKKRKKKKTLTQKSCCSFSRCTRSSNGITQFATKSSGGMAASWNTVRLMFFALCTSWMKYSFQQGSKVFGLVVERSEKSTHKTQNMRIYGREKNEMHIRKVYVYREWKSDIFNSRCVLRTPQNQTTTTTTTTKKGSDTSNFVYNSR